MTGKDLFREIGNISEEYVAEAADYKRKGGIIKVGGKSFSVNESVLKTMSAAACLVLCAVIVYTVRQPGVSKDAAMEMAQEYQNTAIAEGAMEEDAAPMEEKVAGAEAKAEEALSAEMKTEETVKENTVDEGTESAKSEAEMIWKKMASYPSEYEELLKLDGVYILVHGKAEKGQKIWDDFEKVVNAGSAAQVEIVRFTVEGDPIISTVCYDGEGFDLYVDTSRDAFGSGEKFECRYDNMKKSEKVLEDGGKTVEYSLISENMEYSIVYLSK